MVVTGVVSLSREENDFNNISIWLKSSILKMSREEKAMIIKTSGDRGMIHCGDIIGILKPVLIDLSFPLIYRLWDTMDFAVIFQTLTNGFNWGLSLL